MNETTLDNLTLISVLVALGIGSATALIAWLVCKAVSEVPAEDRAYKDPPPWGFRMAWWPISWIAHFIRPFIPEKSHAATQAKLRKAGLDFSVNTTQFIAARVMGMALVACAIYWVIGSFDTSGRLAVSLYLQGMLVGAACGWIYPAIWLKDRLNARKKDLLKSLPFFLDIITLCVEAGLNMQGAINQAVLKGPQGVIRDEFQRVLRDIRAGKGRAASMREMADRLNEPAITNFVTSVIQAESLGMSLGPVLRTQADQRRAERFLRAEKLAMQAPVKMLLPLIAFIFPCTFIVLFFPIAMKFMHSGL